MNIDTDYLQKLKSIRLKIEDLQEEFKDSCDALRPIAEKWLKLHGITFDKIDDFEFDTGLVNLKVITVYFRTHCRCGDSDETDSLTIPVSVFTDPGALDAIQKQREETERKQREFSKQTKLKYLAEQADKWSQLLEAAKKENESI